MAARLKKIKKISQGWSKNSARPMAARLKKKKNKPRVEQEPRLDHGRAVKKNNNKPRVEQEPHWAHGRAVNKKKKPRVEEEPRSAHGGTVKKNK